MAAPTVRDLGASLVRTTVATAIGTGVAWLAKDANIVIDDATAAGVVQAFTATVIVLYYGVVRAAETRVPRLGWLLGLAKLPTYPAPTNTVPVPPSDSVPIKA